MGFFGKLWNGIKKVVCTPFKVIKKVVTAPIKLIAGIAGGGAAQQAAPQQQVEYQYTPAITQQVQQFQQQHAYPTPAQQVSYPIQVYQPQYSGYQSYQ